MLFVSYCIEVFCLVTDCSEAHYNMISVGLESSPGASRRPPTVLCHICGRPYGTASIKIHLPQCMKKFEDEQMRLPPNQRRKLPTVPLDAIPDVNFMSAKELDEHNDAAFRAYNDTALTPCQYCGRTFLPERLAIHNRSCTADRPAKRVGGTQGGTGGRPNSSRAMLSATARESASASATQRHTIRRPTTALSSSPQKLPSLTQVARRTMSSTQSTNDSQSFNIRLESEYLSPTHEKSWRNMDETESPQYEPSGYEKRNAYNDEMEIPQFSEVAVRLLTLSDRFERFQEFVQDELSAMRHELNDLLLHVTNSK